MRAFTAGLSRSAHRRRVTAITPPALAVAIQRLCAGLVAGDRALIMATVNRTLICFTTRCDSQRRGCQRRGPPGRRRRCRRRRRRCAGSRERVDVDTEITRLVPFIEWPAVPPDQLISADNSGARRWRRRLRGGADLDQRHLGWRRPGHARGGRRAGACVCAHWRRATHATLPGELRYRLPAVWWML